MSSTSASTTPKVSYHAAQLRKLLTEQELQTYFERAWDEILSPMGKAPGDQRDRDNFVRSHLELEYPATEWRFQGMFGFGGKFRARPDLRCTVDCYPEDSTPERKVAQDAINAKLAYLTADMLAASALTKGA